MKIGKWQLSRLYEHTESHYHVLSALNRYGFIDTRDHPSNTTPNFLIAQSKNDRQKSIDLHGCKGSLEGFNKLLRKYVIVNGIAAK